MKHLSAGPCRPSLFVTVVSLTPSLNLSLEAPVQLFVCDFFKHERLASKPGVRRATCDAEDLLRLPVLGVGQRKPKGNHPFCGCTRMSMQNRLEQVQRVPYRVSGCSAAGWVSLRWKGQELVSEIDAAQSDAETLRANLRMGGPEPLKDTKRDHLAQFGAVSL